LPKKKFIEPNFGFQEDQISKKDSIIKGD